MKKYELSALEKEMINFDFDALQAEVETSKNAIASATSVTDVRQKICTVWRKVRKYVKWAENIPVAGKFIAILADLLDAICGQSE